jgi:HSP20 family protein
LSDNYWDRWFDRKRRRLPFSGGDFFGDVDDVFREMEEMMERQFKEFSERTPRDLIRERTMPDGSKARQFGPYVYGYSMTIDPDGKPQIREFGNLKPGKTLGKPRVDIKEQREPLIDIMQTDGEVKVIAEVPGVEKTNIKLHGTEKTVTISVNTLERKYYKEIKLPAEVDTKKTKASYNNGVLEITLKKKKEEKSKGEPIIL